MLPIYGTLTIFCSTRARSHSQRVGRASGKSLGAAFLLPADYAREDKDGGVPPAASAGALPRGGRSLTGLQGPCHPRLLGCGGLPGTEGTRHQCARLALGPALHGAAGGRSLLPMQPSSLQATLGQRVLTFTSSGRNWDLARERGLSIPCTCIQLPAGMGTEQGRTVGAGVRAALAPHRGCCCYYFHGRGNMIY